MMRILATALTASLMAGAALATGMPVDGQINMQAPATSIQELTLNFHNFLVWIMAAISIFVLALLLIVVFRYNRKANPTPAKWHHNTFIEVIWTAVPVVILVVIAVPSFQLLFAQENMPEPDLTVKATGYQWYWSYEYPDQEVGEYLSSMVAEDEAKEGHYLLQADYPLVAPVGKTVRVEITAADVIHSFALPAFGMKTDAIPGRVNLDWFKAEVPGTYYGQCSELCGTRHAFMPIHIEIVSQDVFDAWASAKAAGEFDRADTLIAEFKSGTTRLASAE
jgi:cytochrome c oxidase subunit II